MDTRFRSAIAAVMLAAVWSAWSTWPARADGLRLERVWTHSSRGGGAEIVAYDRDALDLLVVNRSERCVTRLDVRTGRERGRLDVSAWGEPTSVAVHSGMVAVAVVAPLKTVPGQVVLFDTKRSKSYPVRVGALPDMVTFTPDGRYVLSANEGEPSDDLGVDPEGSISVIDVSRGVDRAVALTADFVGFNSQRAHLEQQGMRFVASDREAADGRATVAQDLEPEYVAVAPDSRTAWITLQENNGLAEIDVPTARVRRVIGLGLKDHSQNGNGLDASDLDGGIAIRQQPVWGLYQPDGVAVYEVGGEVFLVTANEGDSRLYAGFTDEARVAELRLDESLLRDDPAVQTGARLGRLKVSRFGGDTDGDGDADRLLAFGGRSLAVWLPSGEQVYDSGDEIERYVANHLPKRHGIGGIEEGVTDERSPEKGPEPEGVVLGRVGDSTYAFVGLERTSAVAVFDVSRPRAAALVSVLPLSIDAASADAACVSPEGLAFIRAEDSPLDGPLLAVACEVSGTTVLFRVREGP